MLRNFPDNSFKRQEITVEIEIDLESGRQHRDSNQIGDNVRSFLNTGTSENAAETSRAINSEITSQMSRKFETIRIDLNSHIIEVHNSAIEEKVLPTIQNAIGAHDVDSNRKVDLRSDGPQQNPNGEMGCETLVDFFKLYSVSSNRVNRPRESSIDSQGSDEGYDTSARDYI